MRRLQSLRVLLLLALLGACSDSTAPIDPTGSWSGTTSQGRVVAFTVTSSGITQATIHYRVVGDFCTSDVEMTISGAPVPIENNEFEVEFSTGSADFTVVGRFNSSSSASGTLVIQDFDCVGSVSATWTAAK